jgi:SAM-dependent methyltransferase
LIFKPFHAYPEGNLGWLPAFEATPATLAVSLRVWKTEADLTWEKAFARLRNAHLDEILTRAPSGFGTATEFCAVDAGCSVGISTREISSWLRAVRKGSSDGLKVIGLDASPYMLAVAERSGELTEVVSYVHGLAEDTKLQAGSVDLFSLQFVIHELPAHATRKVFAEAFRILKPGGVLSLIDNDPASPAIQGLPPALFILMKSTEPHSGTQDA